MYTVYGRVGASQTDAAGNMKVVSAIDMIQDCSLHWMESEPSFMKFLSDNKLGMFLLFRQADILRLPAYGERFSTTTSIFQCKGFYGYRNTFLYGENGIPCVKTWSVGAFVSYESGRMVRLPQEEMGRVVIDPKLDMAYLDKRIPLPDKPFSRLEERPVRRGDIDLNGHMNNARYLEAAVELLPPGYAFTRFRAEYKTPAKPGDTLCPGLLEAGDKVYLRLSDRENTPYAVFEFS